MRGHKLIFVGGLHKSGTSLLFKCLRAHHQISGFMNTGRPEDEGQHLQTVYPPAKVYGGPGRFGFRPSSHLDETSALVSSENARRIFGEWASHWDLGKPVLLEKSPPNLIRSRFLQALFPKSYFIMLVRHPIAVSYATQKWSKTSLECLLEHWCVSHEQFDTDRERLRNLLVLSYEGLVASPQSLLNRIYTFVGIPNAPLTEEVRPGANECYFLKWRELQKGKLTKFYADHLTARFEERVNRFGYSIKELEN